LKKKKIQNIIILAIIVLIISSIIAYNYSVDQNKQKGLEFGKELKQIQEDVTQLQIQFYSEKTKWDEGDISKKDLLEFYEIHLGKFKEVIFRYDELSAPELFQSSVDLFKISSETQLESDLQFIEWIKTGDELAKIRSDTQIQEAYEYENLGLVEFQLAKKGIKSYDESELFSAPEKGLKQKVIKISNNMKNECDDKFKNKLNEFYSNELEVDWFNCVNEAEKWETDHMP
jgi:hypothetical protein